MPHHRLLSDAQPSPTCTETAAGRLASSVSGLPDVEKEEGPNHCGEQQARGTREPVPALRPCGQTRLSGHSALHSSPDPGQTQRCPGRRLKDTQHEAEEVGTPCSRDHGTATLCARLPRKYREVTCRTHMCTHAHMHHTCMHHICMHHLCMHTGALFTLNKKDFLEVLLRDE